MSIFGFGEKEAPPPPQAPHAPTPPPAFGVQPQGKKPTARSTTPTFLGAANTPTSGQVGQKTLLGT